MLRALLVISSVLSPLAGENLLANPSFEESTPDGRPRSWTYFVMPQPGAFADVDPMSFGGEKAIMLHTPQPYAEEPANNWSQVVVADVGGKQLEFSGFARTEAVGEAALWLQCFQQSPTRVIAAQTSALNDPLVGTTEWTRLSTKVQAPPSTDFVVVRCVLKGAGSAWFDELRLDFVEDLPAPLDVIEPEPDPLEDVPEAADEPSNLDANDLLQLSQALQRAIADLESSNAQLASRVRELQAEVQRSRDSVDAATRTPTIYGPHPLVPHGYQPESESP